jgi:hypothetical protein
MKPQFVIEPWGGLLKGRDKDWDVIYDSASVNYTKEDLSFNGVSPPKRLGIAMK